MATKQPLNVAIIGAGISGVVTAAHLSRRGVDVTIFERAAEAGGVWVFDERAPPEPSYPAILPSKGEQYPGVAEQIDFPGACHPGLKNNVGTRLMKTSLHEWPEGTPDITTHDVMAKYVQSLATAQDVEKHIRYRTAVNGIEKVGEKWNVTSKLHRRDSMLDGERSSTRSESYDAIVVATGHYHAPRVPDTPGLSALKKAFPGHITHSKGYRGPDKYAGKNVLLIGSGASGLDVGREVGPVAKKLFHSHRNGAFDVPLSMFPEEVIHIGEIDRLEILESAKDEKHSPRSHGDLPTTVHLKDGTTLCNIDYIVMCTGYHITLPFLADFHRDNVAAAEADEKTLVTDGSMYHNLHKDIFYIPDPSLLFVGVPYYTATFSLFEFQAQVVAEVLSGNAHLPSVEDQRKEYETKLQEKGAGKKFHSLRGKEVEYVTELREWVNPQLTAAGRPTIAGHTDLWLAAKNEMVARMQALFGAAGEAAKEDTASAFLAASCTVAPLPVV